MRIIVVYRFRHVRIKNMQMNSYTIQAPASEYDGNFGAIISTLAPLLFACKFTEKAANDNEWRALDTNFPENNSRKMSKQVVQPAVAFLVVSLSLLDTPRQRALIVQSNKQSQF